MSQIIKYGLIGTGRLGSEVEAVFSEKKHLAVFKQDLNETWQEDIPQLLIDCSLPEAFSKTLFYVKKFNVPLIMAASGLGEEQVNELKNISSEVAVVQSYNFSTGIQVLLKLTEIAGKSFEGWDIAVTETHHRFKKDKPSGTANMILEALGNKNVQVNSLRIGNVTGEHTVNFGGLGEVLSITHSATSRRTFAEGILKSAEFILRKKTGFYSFRDVVFNNAIEDK